MSRFAWMVAAALALGTAPAQADKVSDLLGRVVVTADGELLGRVEDLKVDLNRGEVAFVVVSVGSFLIENNLIAVDPKALAGSPDGQYLVIQGQGLAAARRFGPDSWPRSADVMAAGASEAVSIDPARIEAAQNELAERGQATISDGQRTASIKAGDTESQIETVATPRPNPADVAVKPKKYSARRGVSGIAPSEDFSRLDADGDGYLSRREIAPQLSPEHGFGDLDLDGNDGIDPFEFQVLKERG